MDLLSSEFILWLAGGLLAGLLVVSFIWLLLEARERRRRARRLARRLKRQA